MTGSTITKDLSEFKLENGEAIYLQVGSGQGSGQYLSRIEYSPKAESLHYSAENPIVAANNTVDPACQFKVIVQDGSKIALQADNGKYLSRIQPSDNDKYQPIEAAKSSIDEACQFTVQPLIIDKKEYISLQADNGKYLSVISYGNYYAIEAAKTINDDNCRFKVTR